jgi:transcriptional regulator with XRE-family HTH domain
VGALVTADPKSVELLVRELERVASESTQPGRESAESLNSELASIIKKILESLGMSPQELAVAIKVSPATAYRWLKGSSVPRPTHLSSIRALALPGSDIQQAALVPAQFHHGQVGVYSVDYFFDHASHARNIYVIRTEGKFIAENDVQLERQLKELLEEDSSRIIIYLCPQSAGTSRTVTEESFKLLKNRFIWNNWRENAQLQDCDLSTVGTRSLGSGGWAFDLGATLASTFVLEFDDDGKKLHKMEFQILISIPVQRYSSSLIQGSEPVREIKYEQLFIEIPDMVTKEVLRKWSPDLTEIQHNCRLEMDKQQQNWDARTDQDPKS